MFKRVIGCKGNHYFLNLQVFSTYFSIGTLLIRKAAQGVRADSTSVSTKKAL